MRIMDRTTLQALFANIGNLYNCARLQMPARCAVIAERRSQS
jgi:hypothetical protein